MSEEVVTSQGVAINAVEFASLPTERLREILAECLRNQAQNLVLMAKSVKALEDRGEDLSELRIALMPKLRLIACGQLLPEVLLRGWPSRLVQFVSRLPIDQQERLVNGEAIDVSVYGPSGEVTIQKFGPTEIDRVKDLRLQVFASDHVRTLPEQNAILAAQRTKRMVPQEEKIDSGRIDNQKDGGGVWHRREFIPKATLKAWLRALEK